MQLPAVELQADDGKHEDGKKEQQADLQERHHGLHDGFQDNLQAWERRERAQLRAAVQTPFQGLIHPESGRRKMGNREDGQLTERCKRPAQPGGALWAGGSWRKAGEGKPSYRATSSRGCFWSPLQCPACPCPTWTWWDMACASLSPLLPPGHGSSPATAQGRRDRSTGASSSLVSLFIPVPTDEILQQKGKKNPKKQQISPEQTPVLKGSTHCLLGREEELPEGSAGDSATRGHQVLPPLSSHLDGKVGLMPQV